MLLQATGKLGSLLNNCNNNMITAMLIYIHFYANEQNKTKQNKTCLYLFFFFFFFLSIDNVIGAN